MRSVDYSFFRLFPTELLNNNVVIILSQVLIFFLVVSLYILIKTIIQRDQLCRPGLM